MEETKDPRKLGDCRCIDDLLWFRYDLADGKDQSHSLQGFHQEKLKPLKGYLKISAFYSGKMSGLKEALRIQQNREIWKLSH